MPQDIPNDLERHGGAQQTDRSCITKGVRALPSARSDSSHLQTSADDTIKDRSVFIAPIRRLDLQKQLSMLALWSSLLQITQHRFADFTKQRQFGFRPCLRVPHAKDVFLLVNVSRRKATISLARKP